MTDSQAEWPPQSLLDLHELMHAQHSQTNNIFILV